MKIELVLNDYDREAIIDSIVECAAEMLANDLIVQDIRPDICEKVQKIINKETGKILSKVISDATAQLMKKKQIAELTPKARELAAADKDNLKYFQELVDEALKKKFR